MSVMMYIDGAKNLLFWIVGEVGYHATLSRWSSRVRVPYSPQKSSLKKVVRFFTFEFEPNIYYK